MFLKRTPPPLHYRSLKLTTNLILSIVKNPSLPSFNSIHDTKLQQAPAMRLEGFAVISKPETFGQHDTQNER